MDALYTTIFEETKVQQAVTDAEAIRDARQGRGREGNRAGALDAIADLTAIRDTLRQEYQLVIVSRAGEQSAVWRFPEINTDASNYYLIVEALDADRKPLSLPILNEENGTGRDGGEVGRPRAGGGLSRGRGGQAGRRHHPAATSSGSKQYGFLDVNYAVPTLPASRPA